MTETELETAQRQVAELYKRLAQLWPLSPERVPVQMQIRKLNKRIAELQRGG